MHLLTSLILTLVVGSSCVLALEDKAKMAEEQAKLRETLCIATPCLSQSIYLFNQGEDSLPPTTIDELDKACKRQTTGLKCLKDMTKNTTVFMTPILRRGLISFAQTRSRYNKKFCTNFNSELSKKFVNDMKCLREKKRDHYAKVDDYNTRAFIWIDKKSFNDSAVELKYLCCTLLKLRQGLIDGAFPECPASKASVEELVLSIVLNDMDLICEDEEKLTKKVCPGLAPMDFDNYVTKKDLETVFTVGLSLYLFATLGEPNLTA